jgi:hypothetical protein
MERKIENNDKKSCQRDNNTKSGSGGSPPFQGTATLTLILGQEPCRKMRFITVRQVQPHTNP